MASVDKLERLLTLVEVLLAAERPLVIDELRDKVPGYADSPAAARRMFERDKDNLREIGIPIEVVPLTYSDPPQTGYHLKRDDYFLRDPGLESDELAALHLAMQLVRIEGAPHESALWAFGGAPADPNPEGADQIASLPGDARLPVVLDAIAERIPLSFDYASRDGAVRRRTIDPIRIEYQNGNWYLTAHDHERDAVRHFRVDRIVDDQLERGRPGSFELPDEETPVMASDAWRYGEGPAVEAEVLIDAPFATLARLQITDPERIETRPDGSIVIALPVTNRPAFRTFVLGFLEHAEVLGPPELREEIRAWLEPIATGAPGEAAP